MSRTKKCPKIGCYADMVRQGASGWYCFSCKRHYEDEYIQGYHHGYLDALKEEENC